MQEEDSNLKAVEEVQTGKCYFIKGGLLYHQPERAAVEHLVVPQERKRKSFDSWPQYTLGYTCGQWKNIRIVSTIYYNRLVSLVDSDAKVPVTILRDTGVFDYVIQAGVLPLSEHSETGCSFPVWVGVDILFVLLDCDVFQVEAALAVCPALPVEGVSVIIGNNLMGARVWADVPPLLVAAPAPLVRFGTG
ncbi:hypothetical protein EXN66_Car005133 [Channa argus]|uniref:Uncharacterized protein n=1 Tax=Channa argus TaxID=215402 RepID=A0A6G1PGK8_CHAAH|nr:hypothetical protein EXN66_Car005133 [Channa argus]